MKRNAYVIYNPEVKEYLDDSLIYYKDNISLAKVFDSKEEAELEASVIKEDRVYEVHWEYE